MDLQESQLTQTRREQNASERRRERNRNRIIWFGVFLLFVAGTFLSFRKTKGDDLKIAAAGLPLSDFSLPDINGQIIRPADYRTGVLLINFWATWCPHCREEMPLLQAYYETYRSSGLTILAINSGDSQVETADFVEKYRLSFPVGLDSGSRITYRLGIHNLPTSILVGIDGVVKVIHVGSWTEASIQSEITPLIDP
jgi:thiol-disulfide isomerase/thioredoxin